MKKVILVNVILSIIVFIVVMAHAETLSSLSTSKSINVTVVIEPEPIIQARYEIIYTGAAYEKSELEKSAGYISDTSQSRKDSLFSRIIRKIKNIFLPE